MYDELYHWGILGMKWGIRRYQNPDGSLTPAGRKRYTKLTKEISRFDTQPKVKEATRDEKLNEELSGMSTDDIRKYTERMRAESEYKRLKREADPPKKISDMTNEELQRVINRMKLDKEYKDLKTPKKKDIAERLDKYSKFMNSSYKAITSTSNAYNSIARIANAFGDKDEQWKLINLTSQTTPITQSTKKKK